MKTRLTSEQASAFALQAKACRSTQARYLRDLIDRDLGVGQGPRAKPAHVLRRDVLAVEINALGLQVRRLGVNVNQLAKQANSAMVPIERREVVYVLNQLQLLSSAARGVLERVLA